MMLSGASPFYSKEQQNYQSLHYTFPHELFCDISDEAMAFVSMLLSCNIEYHYTAEQALKLTLGYQLILIQGQRYKTPRTEPGAWHSI
jgi:hypothetical protein